MKIIYLDKYIAVCEKSHGELSEGSEKNCIPTLLSQALLAEGEQNTSVFPVHRLDKDTSGLIVLARTPETAAALSKSIVEGELEKEYLAVLCGAPNSNEDTLTDLLFYDRSRSKSFIVDRQRNGVKKAILDYKTLDEKNGLVLVQIKLRTGRTHQIRAQFSHRGLPVFGDRRYGAPKNECKGIALLSFKLCFPHPKDKRRLEFSASIPTGEPWSDFGINQ